MKNIFKTSIFKLNSGEQLLEAQLIVFKIVCASAPDESW